ncbi:MAG: septal ring lytic transglycosylase RlpA family protein [Akkermansia sp.]
MSPYTVRGVRYTPMSPAAALRYSEVGLASHYEAHGARGAIGQRLHRGQFYAAHRTLPLPCVVRITNLANGRSCRAEVRDRGPYIPGRLIDVSSAVAHELGFHRKGLERVRVDVISVGDGPWKRTR